MELHSITTLPHSIFCIILKTAARHRNGARYLKASYLKTAKYISTSCLCDQCDDLYVDGMVAPWYENTHVKLVGFLFIIDHLNTFKNKKGFIKILVYSSVTGIIIGFM